MTHLHVKIDYNENEPLGSYAGVVVTPTGEGEIARFMSGDPQADWAAFIDWKATRDERFMTTSSLDHFLHDVPGWRMIEDDRGIEMIVPEDRAEWLAWEAENFPQG